MRDSTMSRLPRSSLAWPRTIRPSRTYEPAIARLARLDELADLSVALDLLDELRRQEALERELDVIGQLVDDLVQAHVHPGGLPQRPLGTGVEPNPRPPPGRAAKSTSDSLMSPAPR